MIEKDLRQKAKQAWHPCHLTIVEGAAMFGMPDTWWMVDGVGHWIELKREYSGKIKLRVNQKSWMENELKNGGDTWLMWGESHTVAHAQRWSVIRDWSRIVKNGICYIKIDRSILYSGSLPWLKRIIF